MGITRKFTMCRMRQLGGFSAALLIAASVHAQQQAPVSEEAVEAAYLHKFPGFVEWPAEAFKTPASPIVIGLLDAPKVLDELTKLARGRLVLNRPVEARALEMRDTHELPSDLHVLFIGRGSKADVKQLIEEARRAHVLVVTNVPDGLALGGVLDFVRVDGRVRFAASLPAANKTGLKLSSKLLSVASRVVEETP